MGNGGEVWTRDTETGVSVYGLRRMERQRMTNSGVLLSGTARHTFQSTDGMLVMERGLPERITEYSSMSAYGGNMPVLPPALVRREVKAGVVWRGK
jgi:hypothetical protein